jgi:hypothetical protein
MLCNAITHARATAAVYTVPVSRVVVPISPVITVVRGLSPG